MNLLTMLILGLKNRVNMEKIKPHCYSQRMLNTFRGVMNVIGTGDADAVTTDGNVWTLYSRDYNLLTIANDGEMVIEVSVLASSLTVKFKVRILSQPAVFFSVCE